MKCIDQLIEKYKSEFDNTFFYGVPITELNKEQLMAVISFIGANKCKKCDSEESYNKLLSGKANK